MNPKGSKGKTGEVRGPPNGAWTAHPSPVEPGRSNHAAVLASAVERELIPRLIAQSMAQPPLGPSDRPDGAHALDAAAAASPAGRPATAEVEVFTAMVLQGQNDRIEAFLLERHAQGMSSSVLLRDLLVPVARRLGQLWEADACHFTDVTVGVARLHQAMRDGPWALGASAALSGPGDAPRILLAAAPGSQHTFGLSMVAEYFYHDGWDVSADFATTVSAVGHRSAREWFDVVGFSLGSEELLPALARAIAEVRRNSLNTAARIIIGGPLFVVKPELSAHLDADACVTDGERAPRIARQLLPLPASID